MRRVFVTVGALLVLAQVTPAAEEVSPRTLLRQAAAAPPWEQEALLRQSLEQYPDYPPLLLLLGGALIFSGQWEEARVTLNRTWALLPAEARAMRAVARFRLAIVDAHVPDRLEQVRRALEQLLKEGDLPPTEHVRAQLALVRQLGIAGELAEAEGLLARAERQLTATDGDTQDQAVAERFLLDLRQRRLAEARKLLRRLSTSTNRYAWWVGVLGRLSFDAPEAEVQQLVASAPVHELPAVHRPSALALAAAFAGEAWEEMLAQHMQRYPFDTSAHLVGAWLARREGQPNWRRYLEAGTASFPRGAWLSPVWVQEGP